MAVSSAPASNFAPPCLGQDEIDEVVATLQSGGLSTGPRVHRFEAAFADCVGARHAIAVDSCTAALNLALLALEIGLGDEVSPHAGMDEAPAEIVAPAVRRAILGRAR